MAKPACFFTTCKYNTKEAMLNELDILSKLKIVSSNTNLSVGNIEVGKSSDEEKILDTINTDITNMSNKIMDFSANNNQSAEEKISYTLGGSKDANDGFYRKL